MQDDFKVQLESDAEPRPALGVRLADQGKNNKQVNFDITTGERIYVGDRGLGDGLYEAYYGGFSPRVGLRLDAERQDGLPRRLTASSSTRKAPARNCRLPLNPPFFGELSTAVSSALPAR